MAEEDTKPKKERKKKRSYLSQTDVPSHPLSQAMRIPRALADHYAFRPATPLDVAAALDMAPNSGTFRTLCGAAIAYGLTQGGPKAAEIELAPLGLRIVRPTEENDDVVARREALLQPRVVGEFLRRYDQSPIPREDIGANVLVTLGVPKDRSRDVLELILEGAEATGVLRTIKGKRYIDLGPAVAPSGREPQDEDEEAVRSTESTGDSETGGEALPATDLKEALPVGSEQPTGARNRRVFVSHGRNKAFIEPIKKLLGFGEMEAVVSVERSSVSQPVPDKVLTEMRLCGAAIIHVDAEESYLDAEGNERVLLNPNVLIEIGAAMALYGRRFILLTKEGVRLPSNLQGLFEVRYSGSTLDGNATIRLLEAINSMKQQPEPDGA